MGVIAVT